ncbi:unnamed protein product, partial [Effrenium voratum]
VALLSPGYSPESQQELVQSKYLAMVQDLDVHCSRVSERVAAFQTALEGERGENCCRALQLCDQQRRTTRLHEVLCQLQSELFQTRRDAGKRTADAPTETAGKQEIPLGSSGSAQTNGTLPASHPVALGVSQDTAVETHSADAADPKAAAAEVSRAPPEPSPAPAVTPVTPVNPERGSERDRVESAMREILEELRFEHLVMRCQGCYEFGALARAQLRMDNDTLTASVDGVMYEPFKEFICKLQASTTSSRRNSMSREDPVALEAEALRPEEQSPSHAPERGALRTASKGASSSPSRPRSKERRGVAEKGPASGQGATLSRASQAAKAAPRKNGTPRAKENGILKPPARVDPTRSKVDKKGVDPATPVRNGGVSSHACSTSEGLSPSNHSGQLSRNASSTAGSCVVGSSLTNPAASSTPACSPSMPKRAEQSFPGYPSPRMACVSPPRAREVRAMTPQPPRAACAATPRSFVPSPPKTPLYTQASSPTSMPAHYVMLPEGFHTVPRQASLVRYAQAQVTPRRHEVDLSQSWYTPRSPVQHETPVRHRPVQAPVSFVSHPIQRGRAASTSPVRFVRPPVPVLGRLGRMFFDPFLTDEDDGITPARAAGTSGEKVTLTTNSFRIVWEGKDSYIFQYQYDLPDRDISQREEKKLLEQVWGDLKQKLTHFIVRCPGEIFSPKLVPDFSVAVKGGDGDETSQFKVSFMSKIHADQINEGIMGTASVVGQHIVRKLAEPLRIQKVGKRYYNNCPQGKTNQLVIIGGFCANMAAVGKAGPLLRLDMTPRLVRKETIANTVLEVCRGNGMDPWAFTEDAVKAEWCKHCVSATVVTSYNSRVYRIKAVHFDMNPADKFTMYHRDSKEYTKLSYAEYLQAFYSMPCTHENQPLLEAYPEKASEQVFLLPEFCSQTGLSPEMRKDKSSYVEALKQLKVAPQDRYEAIITHAKDMCTQQTVMKEWGCYLPSKPLQVEGRLLSSLQVAYKEKKFGTVEEGSWERSLRNGLQCAVKLEKWLLVYPKEDEQVVDIWLGSFRDIAQVAFGLTTAQPTRIVLDTMGQLYTTLKTVMPDRPELVLLLMPHKETKAYMVFKRTMATEFPCISQVVTSETIRKRQNIAKILSRVVLQINAKFGAPLWNIIPPEQAEDSQDFVDFKKTPSMVVGIELHETSCTLGLVATLDNTFSQHFSKAAMMDKK